MPRRDLLCDLRALIRATGSGVFTLAEAAAALQLSRREATLRLRAMARYGVIRRVARGLFFIVPIKRWDPRWDRGPDSAVLAAALFSPCYIGGWTAAEWWYLHVSVGPEVFVVTSSRIRARSVEVGGVRFRLTHVPEERIAGPGIVSRHGDAGAISTPERTLVDALRSPSWLGGARPLASALRNYCLDDGSDRDKLTEMLLETGNGAAIKRLAALDHLLNLGLADVLNPVAERRTRGISDLEPGAGRRGPIDTWSGVRLNVALDEDEDAGVDPEMWDEEFAEVDGQDPEA